MGHSNCFTQPDLDGACLQAKQESSPTENVLQKEGGKKSENVQTQSIYIAEWPCQCYQF